MNTSGEKLVLAHDSVDGLDARIKNGIYSGLVIRRAQGHALNPTEEVLLGWLNLTEGAEERKEVSLTRNQAGVALNALQRTKDFLRLHGVFEMRDRDDPWESLSVIEDFVMPRSCEVVDI